MSCDKMYVIKRDGSQEEVHFDRITERLQQLANFSSPSIGVYALDNVQCVQVAKSVISSIYNNIPTIELDAYSVNVCRNMISYHPDYGYLAARIDIDNLHRSTSNSFSMTEEELYVAGILSKTFIDNVRYHKNFLDKVIDYDRDYLFDSFAVATLKRSYLLRVNNVIRECPQHMWMRVALGIHGKSCPDQTNLADVAKTYNSLSMLDYTHATPTLFHAGFTRPQLSSCFLMGVEDSLDNIFYDSLGDASQILKWAGGLGIHVTDVRPDGDPIQGTNGNSNGIVPMLKVFEATSLYVDQGGGKRKGSIAVYIEPWHGDIMDFLELTKQTKDINRRAKALFLALWTPDLFMEKVEKNEDWYLMSPLECPGLSDVYGEEFNALYHRYVAEGRYIKKVKAMDVWQKVLALQLDSGRPYVLFKDACNKKSNQQNLGTIKSSNLCSEIIQYTSSDEIAVCNLASLCLSRYVDDEAKQFDFMKLREKTRELVVNLNRVIDVNYYPVERARTSNMRHRPIGIGVQGLADVFMKLKIPYDSEEAKDLNRQIAETIYFSAMEMSCKLAKEQGTYESFRWNGGCPASRGVLQFNLWNVTPSSTWDWASLKEDIKTYGLRNSLTTAYMPTASTSIICGNNECFEPITSNIFTRQTLAGTFQVVNKHLIKDLVELGLWNKEMRDKIIQSEGSIQSIPEIPDNLKKIYKTVWEIKNRTLIDMDAGRSPFICQSSSSNRFVTQPTYNKLTAMHMYAWKRGLKTGCYYVRSTAAVEAPKFTISKQPQRSESTQTQSQSESESKSGDMICTDEICTMCSA